MKKLPVFLLAFLILFGGCKKAQTEPDTITGEQAVRIASFLYSDKEGRTQYTEYTLFQYQPYDQYESTGEWGDVWLCGRQVQDKRFEYEEGYEYVFKYTTVWDAHPDPNIPDTFPLSRKYTFISKTKTDTQVKEENIRRGLVDGVEYYF